MNWKLLARFIERGTLVLIEPDGSRHRFGKGRPEIVWRVLRDDVLRRIGRDPAFEIGETYMDGGWTVEQGSLVDLLTLLRSNVPYQDGNRWQKRLRAAWQQYNDVRRSRRNVGSHYDLDEALFRSFLDREMHYSCAYFRTGRETLEEAQEAKAELIARKLRLQPGMHVLDIGCGWGSMARHLASRYDVSVTGLTLSGEQLRVAREEARRRGLAHRLTFLLEDYREHRGHYDRVVSVGMFEHVGRRQFPVFFDHVRNFLAPDGVALLHTIGQLGTPTVTNNPWIDRYIFPGGYIPALSEVAPVFEAADLVLTDLEVLRMHYAETLRAWHERFAARWQEHVAERGERFCRMWRFYLAASESAFRTGDLGVFHFQLAQDVRAVPSTRDYLTAVEPVASARQVVQDIGLGG